MILPVLAVVLLGERTSRPLDELKDWLLTHNAAILVVVLLVLSAKLLGSGLALAA